MPDVFSAEKRSKIMRRIKSKNTSPEMKVRSFLHGAGFRYRVHAEDLPGTPDIKLPKYRTVVFVNGCFWHQHPKPSCKLSKLPASNQEYWIPKLKKNTQRDKKNIHKLVELGWNVIVIWECEISEATLLELAASIHTNYFSRKCKDVLC